MKTTFSVKAEGINVGYVLSDNPSPKIADHHCHDKYELLYVMNGKGKYVVEGSEFTVAPRTVMIIRPFAYHHLSLDDSISYERFVIHFSKSTLSGDVLRMFDAIVDGEEGCGKYFSSLAVTSTLSSVFDRFETAISLSEEERAAYIKVLFSEIVILLSAADGERMMNTEGELGARVITYLNENIHKDLSLDKLARRFFVSKYYLCRAFKKHNGISVHGYINQKRIMYAKRLIESGETASSAAYKVGFGDYSAFYRAYVKILGKSPTTR